MSSVDTEFWVSRPLRPGEKPCAVRSRIYGDPTPHLRTFGGYGLCQACQQPRRKYRLDHRLLRWWWSRKWRRETARGRLGDTP